MRLSMPLSYGSDVRHSLDQAVALEAVGLDIAWVAEAYGIDAVSAMGYLAARTTRLQIGSGILPIYSRTPALLAQTAAGVDLLSGGRAILGLGASGPQVIEGWHGVPYAKPLRRTRETIEICRKVWRREPLTYDGDVFHLPLPAGQGVGMGKSLKLITHPVRERIPIFVAALGDKNVEMTAEIAEGWLPTFYIPEKASQVWGAALAQGLKKRPVELGPLEIVAGGPVAIGEGLGHLRDLARPSHALYMGGMGARGFNFYNDLLRRYGFEDEADQVQSLYLEGKREAAAAALPAELMEKTSLIGPPGYVRERIAAYRETGVTVLNVTPVGPDPGATISQLKEMLG